MSIDTKFERARQRLLDAVDRQQRARTDWEWLADQRTIDSMNHELADIGANMENVWAWVESALNARFRAALED